MPIHHYKWLQFLFILKDSDEEFTNDTTEISMPPLKTLLESLFILLRNRWFSTLKLSCSVNMHKVVVVLNGGSTNNFIQTRLATHLALWFNLHLTYGLWLEIESYLDAKAPSSSSFTTRLDLFFYEIFTFFLYILQTYLVLGVQQFSEVGAILFDYKIYGWNSHIMACKVCLLGLQQTILNYISTLSLKRWLHTQALAQYFHLVILPKLPQSSCSNKVIGA